MASKGLALQDRGERGSVIRLRPVRRYEAYLRDDARLLRDAIAGETLARVDTRGDRGHRAQAHVLLLALVVGCTKVNLEPIDGAGGGGGQAQAQTNTSTNNTSGQGGAGQGGTTGSGGASNILFYIDNIVQSANCQPAIPPDPLMLMFTFNVATTRWTAMITPVGARIDSSAGSTSFQTDMMAFTPGPNVEIGVEVRKLPDTAVGAPACSHCGSQDAVLYVDIEVDGSPETVSEPIGNYNCVF